MLDALGAGLRTGSEARLPAGMIRQSGQRHLLHGAKLHRKVYSQLAEWDAEAASSVS